MHQPHVPRVPNPKFVGKSGMGPRGDAILEADYSVGEILKTLKTKKLLDNTIIIFSSDNGPVLNDGYYDDAVEKIGNHTPAGILRGGKYSLFVGGTKVPLIVSWPKTIPKGKVSNATVCQLDFITSFAYYFNEKLNNKDGINLWDTFLGKSDIGREELVLESSLKLAFKYKKYAYIPPTTGPERIKDVNNETGFRAYDQLYDISNDPSQKNNLAESQSEILETIKKRFFQITGR